LLRASVTTIGNVHAVMVDPLNAYFGHGRINIFRDDQVRSVLGPFTELAAELNIAVIALAHFNKKTDVENILLRLSNSLAFAAAARAVYGVVYDDMNKRTLVVRGKNNITTRDKVTTLGFLQSAKCVGTDPKTTESIWAPYIDWLPEPLDITAEEAMADA